jgi:Arc/MetJ family transcription regulator
VKPILAWHFVADILRDGQPVPPHGVTLTHSAPLIMCQSGLHASLHPFDALPYAPGPNLCLVACGGDILYSADKIACTERTIVARMDATPLLRYCARQRALSVVHLWDAPQLVLDYLMGDDTLRAAALSVAQRTVQYASRPAVRYASGSAAASAAEYAATSAARSAAWSAAEAAAMSTARSAVRSVARYAARYAAESVIRSAAKSAARDEFDALVRSAFADWL